MLFWCILVTNNLRINSYFYFYLSILQ
jgi:hypothetical protein